ncbi:response regulator transcription factor [Flavobacterium franklandianum]|uniref:response regulator transcription factor n=1 Tax=Flavobacterium franklandianum TaxID=2594430 RepID=UPI001F3C6D81|nr:LuxR C-terminal-related transcriptional regulator [Flavobacterium franklandianum]
MERSEPKIFASGNYRNDEWWCHNAPFDWIKTLKLFRNPTVFENILDQEEYNLTPLEIEVLEHLSKGLKYNAIAENLFLSSGTIRKHIENIYTKLQVHNKLEAMQTAKNNKLI